MGIKCQIKIANKTKISIRLLMVYNWTYLTFKTKTRTINSNKKCQGAKQNRTRWQSTRKMKFWTTYTNLTQSPNSRHQSKVPRRKSLNPTPSIPPRLTPQTTKPTCVDSLWWPTSVRRGPSVNKLMARRSWKAGTTKRPNSKLNFVGILMSHVVLSARDVTKFTQIIKDQDCIV